jgi:hypothetical protein
MAKPRKVKDPNAPTIVKVKKVKLNRSRDVGDPKFDLIAVFKQKDIGTISDSELEDIIENLQKMRLMRFTLSKRKTPLDKILEAIKSPEKAREILASFKEFEEKS